MKGKKSLPTQLIIYILKLKCSVRFLLLLTLEDENVQLNQYLGWLGVGIRVLEGDPDSKFLISRPYLHTCSRIDKDTTLRCSALMNMF